VRLANLSNRMAQMRERKQKLEGELRRLASTAAETGPSAFLVEAIHYASSSCARLRISCWLVGQIRSMPTYRTFANL
jgi:hypothetical protein